MSTRVRLVALVLAAGLLAACGGGDTADSPGSAETSGEVRGAEQGPEPAALSLLPEDAAGEVAPADAVSATVEHGELSEVSLTGTHGSDVEGSLNSDETQWSSAEPLGYDRTYVLEATAVGHDGDSVTETAEFTTVAPQQEATVEMNIPDGATVGVGMPVSLQFSTAIADKDALEDAIEISSDPEVEGDFHWFNDSWLMWRPKDHWEPGTEVTVDAEIYGKDFGEGVYGAQDRAASMDIGEEVIAKASGSTHEMEVTVDGESERTIPVSLGKPSTPTPNGVYTIMSEHRDYTMDSSTFGVPVNSAEGYEITVTHAVRMSYGGIFYHSAPWSLGAQGNSNVSNGCINMSTEDAQWMMDNSKPGDLIEVVDAGERDLEASDGWSVWQMSWDEWSSGGVNA